MKIKHLLILLAATISFFGCKKEALTVDTDKNYYQTGINYSPTTTYTGGMILTLQPNGKANILMFGDIMEPGTYEINGNKLNIQTAHGTYKYVIISDTELVYNDEFILKLRQ